MTTIPVIKTRPARLATSASPSITAETRFKIPSCYGKVLFKLAGTHMVGDDLHYDLLDANEKSKVPIYYDIAEKAIQYYAERKAVFFEGAK